MLTENRKKTTWLACKYFYEQDVENDKHSSWVLNRSVRQCVVCRVCTCFSGEKWSRWECGVINIDPPPCLLVCSCLWLLSFYFFVHVCFSSLSPVSLSKAWIWHTDMKRNLLFRKDIITFLLILPIFNPQPDVSCSCRRILCVIWYSVRLFLRVWLSIYMLGCHIVTLLSIM